MGGTRTLTFLFTDIEGSTRLWERDEEVMRRDLRVHDEILGGILGGRGEIFKKVGDGMCTCFESPRDALAAAIEAQHVLQSHEWEGPELRVRMAISTGYAESRDGDYFGRELNRTARLLSIAHGDQILVARTTADLAGETLGQEATLTPLGEFHLRDLEKPETVLQLTADGLQSEFPELKQVAAHPHNLPLEVTSIVGRERELADIWDLVQAHRLVTLTGMGGMGKTRLSMHVARTCIDDFEDGVWFVEFAPLREQELVVQTVASVVGAREVKGRAISEVLVDHLRNKSVLIVLDNCEHVLDACAELVDSIQRACARIRVLASSREPFSVSGEQVYRLKGLPIPSLEGTGDELLNNASVRLFIARAVLADSSFLLNRQTWEAVTRICIQLEGIPLAIELAAARVKAMGVNAIADRLQDRFRLLTGGPRRGASRQQTLRAAIDWSYDLLDAQERTLLARLSTFAGGWTLEMAEVVGDLAGDETLGSEGVLEVLTRLVEKSMAMYDESSDRYRLLETVRQYAAEALARAGELEETQQRHALAFSDLAAEAAKGLLSSDQESWLKRMAEEHDNFRLALSWCATTQDFPEARRLGMSMAANLWRFWDTRGLYEEGRSRLASLLSQDQTQSPARGAALDAAGRLAYYQGEFQEARKMFEEAAELFKALGLRGLEHHAIHGLAMALANCGEEGRTRPMLESCLTVFQEEGDLQGVARALNALGFEALGHGDHLRAEPYIRQALEVRRRLNDVQGETVALYYLGACAAARGDLGFARECLEQTYSINQRLNYPRGMANSLIQLAAIGAAEGKTDEALESIREATRLAITLHDQATITATLAPWAAIAKATGNARARIVLLNSMEANKSHTGLLPNSFAEPSAEEIQQESAAAADAATLGRAMGAMEAAEYALREVGANAQSLQYVTF